MRSALAGWRAGGGPASANSGGAESSCLAADNQGGDAADLLRLGVHEGRLVRRGEARPVRPQESACDIAVTSCAERKPLSSSTFIAASEGVIW